MSFISMFRKPDLDTLLKTLAAEFEGTLPPGAGGPDRFVFDVTHRVQLWYDRAHGIESHFGSLTAYRAITVKGQLVWFVHGHERGDRFHADAETAIDAMTRATAAWDQARRACGMSRQLTKLTEDLRRGRTRLQVTMADATLTPMSPLGFRAALDAAGLFGINRISGRTLVRLMKKEPQLAYVLHAAWERERMTPETDSTPTRDAASFAALC